MGGCVVSISSQFQGGEKQEGREMLRVICYLVMLQKCATTVTQFDIFLVLWYFLAA